MDVEDTPIALGSGGILVQNLGDDYLFVGETDEVSDENGVRIGPGESIALAVGRSFYAVSGEGITNDVRILPRATGIFPATPAAE